MTGNKPILKIARYILLYPLLSLIGCHSLMTGQVQIRHKPQHPKSEVPDAICRKTNKQKHLHNFGTKKPYVMFHIRLSRWRRRDSNPRPLHCERSALPTELRPLMMFAGFQTASDIEGVKLG